LVIKKDVSYLVCMCTGEAEAEHGQDVLNNASVSEWVLQADARWDETSQLRHADQFSWTCRRL